MNEAFEKEMADLEAKVKERRIYRDKLLDKAHPPSKTTPQQIARYSRLNGQLEQIEEDIAAIEGRVDDGCEHESDDDNHTA
jgi:hypothetical protein